MIICSPLKSFQGALETVPCLVHGIKIKGVDVGIMGGARPSGAPHATPPYTQTAAIIAEL
jgi:hypothetical protein